MKKNIPLLFCAMISLFTLFSSCKKENGSKKAGKTITLFTPVYGPKNAALDGLNGNPNEAVSQTGKIYIKDNFIYLNDQNKGIHVFDNSNHNHIKKST